MRNNCIFKTVCFPTICGCRVLLCLAALALAPSAQAAVCYRAAELNASNLVGAYAVYPGRLTDSGKMTGIIYYTNKPYSMLYYSPESGFVDLGTWKGMGTRGMDINERGQIAVQVGDQQGALRYTPGVGFEKIGSLPGSAREPQNASLEINEHGDITGINQARQQEYHAFFWREGERMQDLGTLGGWTSRANGLNDFGWVSGASRTADGVLHAFLYRPGRGMVDLGIGLAGDINNQGVIIGSDRNGLPVLFYGEEAVPVRTPFGVASYSLGSINEHNMFVGTYFCSWCIPPRGFTGIIGTRAHGIVKLDTLVSSNSGWQLIFPSGLNNKCQIVGTGVYQNRETIFKLDPVVPALSLQRAGTNLSLSWEDTIFPLRLEESATPQSSNWQAVAGVQTNTVTLPMNHDSRFYRLTIPPPPPPAISP